MHFSTGLHETVASLTPFQFRSKNAQRLLQVLGVLRIDNHIALLRVFSNCLFANCLLHRHGSVFFIIPIPDACITLFILPEILSIASIARPFFHWWSRMVPESSISMFTHISRNLATFWEGVDTHMRCRFCTSSTCFTFY